VAPALAATLAALAAGRLAGGRRQRLPRLGQRLLCRVAAKKGSSAGGDAAADAEGGSGKQPAGADGKPGRASKKEVYPAHMRAAEITKGLKSGKLVSGTLHMLKNTCYLGCVKNEKEQIMTVGSQALNRAIEGDEVVVERLDDSQAQVYEAAAKQLRHGVGSSGQDLTEADVTDLAKEVAQEKSAFEGKTKGRIVSVVKRQIRELCGSISPLDNPLPRGIESLGEGQRIFIPSDLRFPYMFVEPPDAATDFEGKRVLVSVNVWDRYSEIPRGKFIKTLGAVGDVNVETQMILMEHQICNDPWTEEVLACLPPSDYKITEEELKGREDVRKTLVFSIDPPKCEDIDDALSCVRLDNGNFAIGIHIADVTNFVLPGTALDKEASARCTSVYLVDRRIDMLPKLLTTDICSLRANEDHLTFSCFVELTPEGEIVSERFAKSVIHSAAQLSYADAQSHLDGEIEERPDITQAICDLNSLAVKIRAERFRKGALELSTATEMSFELDGETGKPTNLFVYKSYSTNKLIEEFMLLANQAAARFTLDMFRKTSVLRNHLPPKEKSMAEIKELLRCHGIEDFDYSNNKALSESLKNLDKPDDPFFNRLVSVMVTRSMNEATYISSGDVKPQMYHHFGLAMDKYTHFTSPIRRYADVLVHRGLMASLKLQDLPEGMADKSNLTAQLEQLNYRNRMARWADSASDELHRFLFFKEKGPITAVGVVMRVSQAGLSVAVEEYGAEGVVELSAMDWLVLKESQAAHGRPLSPYEGISVHIFDRLEVCIEADTTDNRHRKLKLTFVSLPKAAARLGDGAALRGEGGLGNIEAEEETAVMQDVGA